MSNVTLQSFIGPNFWQTLVIAQSSKDLADLRRHHVGGDDRDNNNDNYNDKNDDNYDDNDDNDIYDHNDRNDDHDENDDNDHDHDDDDATKAPTDEPKKCKNNIPS